MFQACNELILNHLYPIFRLVVLAVHAGKGSPFVGPVQRLNVCVCSSFTPSFLSGLLNQRPEAGRASLWQELIYALPSLCPCSPCPAYNDGAQERKNIRCTQDRYFMQDDLEESAERKACQFKRSSLGDCSGLQDPHYGYSQGRPCVLLRMNRVR